MKKQRPVSLKSKMALLMLLAVALCPPALLAAAEDCPKSSDACSAVKKSLSPFVEASLRESKPPHADEVRKASAPAAGAAAAEPAVAVSTAPAARPAAPEKLSSPAWLLLVAGGFAGLYMYLRGGGKKRRRK